MQASLRRMSDEDPTLDVHRDEQTNEFVIGGLGAAPRRGDRRAHQAQVRRRGGAGGAEGALQGDDQRHRPRPRASTRSRPAATASTATAGSRSSRCRAATASSSWTRSSAAPSRGQFIPAVEKGVVEALREGGARRLPHGRRQGDALRRQVPRRRLVGDGVQDRRVARLQEAAFEKAGPVLLEPIMRVEVTVPADHVGDVMGDLNSRRGHVLGARDAGQATRSSRPRCRWPRCSATRPTCAP